MSLLPKPKTLRVTPDILEEIRLSSGTGQLFEIRPYVDSPQTIEDNIEMFKAFHETQYSGFPFKRNKSPTNAFEVWFDGDNIRLMMYIGDRYATKRAIRHVSSNFPSASIELPDEVSGTAFLNIEEDDHVAAANFKLKMHTYAPIRNPRGVEQWTEPYRNIIADMTDEREVREVIQILFKPVKPGWTSSFFNDVSAYADDWAEKRTVERLGGLEQDESPAAEEALKAQSNIKSQLDQPGFYINIRVITASKNPHAAEDQCKEISRSVRDYYREWTGQQPVPVYQSGYDIQRQLYDMVSRQGQHMHWPYNPMTWRKRKKTGLYETLIMTIPELAGLAHIPNGTSLNTEAIEWERLDSSNSLPANAPRYEDFQTAPSEDDEEDTDGDASTDATPVDGDGSDSPDETSPREVESPSEADVVDNDSGSAPALDEPRETPPELDDGPSTPAEEAKPLPQAAPSPELPEGDDSEDVTDSSDGESEDEEPIASGSKPRSTNDVVKQSGEVWTKPEAGDDDYNPAKDNRNYRTGYKDRDGAGDWTGGQAREDDLNGDFDKYVPPSEREPEPEPAPEPKSEPPTERPSEESAGDDSTETPPSQNEPDTDSERPTASDQSDLEPWERGPTAPADSEESEDDSPDEDDSFDELNQAAVEGMMENEGRPPEFRDDRGKGRPAPEPVEGHPEPSERESGPEPSDEAPQSKERSEELPEVPEDPEEADDGDTNADTTTDEAKDSTNTHAINAVWASWDDTLTRDSEDSEDESDEDDGSDDT